MDTRRLQRRVPGAHRLTERAERGDWAAFEPTSGSLRMFASDWRWLGRSRWAMSDIPRSVMRRMASGST